MKNYYRIKGYDPKHDFMFVLDSYGMFEKKWQFSSFLIHHGLKVIDILDISETSEIQSIPNDKLHLYLIKTNGDRVTNF